MTPHAYHTFMVKTTLYLPEQLKKALERASSGTGRSEAELVREALAEYLGTLAPDRPDFPLLSSRRGPGTSSDSTRVDELLAETGFGEC